MAFVTGKEMVNVNSKKIRNEIDKKCLSMITISVNVLKKSKNYLDMSLKNNRLPADCFDKLMDFLDIPDNKRSGYLMLDIPKNESLKKIDDKTVAIVDPKGLYKEQFDILIVGINTLYETQAELVKINKDILVELKANNTKLDRLEKRLASVENATGQIVSKTIVTNDKLDDQLTNIQDMKSTLNIVKGRTTDICDGLKKKANLKVV